MIKSEEAKGILNKLDKLISVRFVIFVIFQKIKANNTGVASLDEGIESLM